MVRILGWKAISGSGEDDTCACDITLIRSAMEAQKTNIWNCLGRQE
jgi:hypothetical protein